MLSPLIIGGVAGVGNELSSSVVSPVNVSFPDIAESSLDTLSAVG